MEEKLAAYRRRKRQKEALISFKNKVIAMIPFAGGKPKDDKDSCVVEPVPDLPAKPEPVSYAASDTYSDDLEEEPLSEEEEEKTPQNKWLKYGMWVLYFLFWATCYAIAIELKFGMVFLLFSALFGIYFNTRTRPRRKNEMSPYSVFNEGCESIDGTLKAEQFEREIRYGSASVR
ncbi:unnamed protein product [Hermetia illucens]|uniref:SAYSvFN domain-containing protein n=1 Tax=Hermetia illucens TaxID=343691 RepID=A0A7R8UN54_HERIL|nr:SAYSvFN domain-containing protein 1 [Hermetia illucens]CAD7083953.1 unnamed protein product [Hermetia illucens]